tara:strand:+ start:16277 stop:17608 length:1332 start_codon:yes stop_codon:yes gene_type:complete
MSDYIFGLNKSGLSILKLLKKQKKTFDCWDDNKKNRILIKRSFPKVNFKENQKVDLNTYDNIYLTPAISLKDNRFKQIPNLKFKRDLNLYYQNLKKEKVIAITGTNGKSTTTKLIGEILKKKFKKTFIGGNIGNALCNSINSKIKYSHHVIELSSFQLETIKNFEPKISILLNLSNDHLDRYKNFNEYICVKKNILNKSSKNINLISLDDKYCKKIFNSKKINNKISFSIKDRKADFYFSKGFIFDNYFYQNKKIKLTKLSKDLKNSVSIQTIIVSYIVCKYLRIPIKCFYESIKDFRGLPYRAKIIYNSNIKQIINNSKATNISSALTTLVNKKNIYLILGGIAKENRFDKFREFSKEIKQIYIYGKSRHKIKEQIKFFMKSNSSKNLKDLVNCLWKDISNIDKKITIIFAPACSSFDQFKNFEERGEYFNQLIFNKIKNEY